MCGRFSLAVDGEFLASFFGLIEVPIWTPRFNIAPTQTVIAVRSTGSQRTASRLRWGLIPSWSRDPRGASLMINARSESAREKPAFRSRVVRGRCLIPADGFYEWKKNPDATKQPFWFSYHGQKPFAFAGLWDNWSPPEGPTLESCTILTTQAQGWMTGFHERMPVILGEQDWKSWLGTGEIDQEEWQRITGAFQAQPMVPRRVGVLVNRVGFDGPDCLEEINESTVEPEKRAPNPKENKAGKEPLKRPGSHQGELF